MHAWLAHIITALISVVYVWFMFILFNKIWKEKSLQKEMQKKKI